MSEGANVQPGPTATATSAASRLEEFEREIGRLGVKAGGAEPERLLVIAGTVLVGVGVVLAVVAWIASNGTNSTLDQNDSIIMALIGVILALVGAMLWARYSLSRYLRYWLVRLIYEDRQQADRITDALARIEGHLAGRADAAPTTRSAL